MKKRPGMAHLFKKTKESKYKWSKNKNFEVEIG